MPRSKARLVDRELQEVWKRDDDWTEATTKEERKKRQNRLNQRAYRRRHQETSSTKQKPFRIERFRISEVPRPALTGGEEKNTSMSPPTEGSKRPNTLGASMKEILLSYNLQSSIPQPAQTVSTQTLNTSANPQLSAPLVTNISTGLELGCQSTPTILDSTLARQRAFDSHTTSPGFTVLDGLLPSSKNIAPSAEHFAVDLDEISPPNLSVDIELSQDTSLNLFPLSSDHLLHLIHQNVFRALMTNKSLLTATASLRKVELDIVLPMSQNFCDGVSVIHSKPDKALPQSLEPTVVQMNIAHSSWMNMFPFPKLRDNLIRYERDFDHADLCNDLFGEIFSNQKTLYNSSPETSHSSPLFSSSVSTSETSIVDPWEDLDDEVTTRRKGLIVWGESWDFESWEVTPGFVRKWPWLLRDCEDLIACSNRWRAKRCERPLMYPSSLASPAMA